MLTPRQKQILDFVIKYSERKGYSPSLEEIARHFRLRSVGTVHEHVEALRSKGYLNKEDNRSRSIRLTNNKKKGGLVEIPLLGTIAAGQPIEAIENPETIEIPKYQLSRSDKHYALRVQGDSMIDDGIYDGDIVVIRKQATAENGETVVALINDNEVTLKKIYKERGGFRLQPANPNVKPIFTKELMIQGKVVHVIRNFEELKRQIEKKKEFDDLTVKYIEETELSYRKSLGQYFTPRSIREALISRLPNALKSPKVLDPGCGTSEFLVTAKEHFKDPDLYGWDIDQNLIRMSKKVIPEAKFKCLDSLLSEDYEKYDFVIGNPPYFEFSPSVEIRRKFRTVINGRVNIFNLFICQGLNWLKEGGYLAYVVPPSMNNGAYFAKLRQFIVENSNIEYLHVLDDPKVFHGALQSTMLLILRKGKNKRDYVFEKNGILIFSEQPNILQKEFHKATTLFELGYRALTGRIVWNQRRNLLTSSSTGSIPLIWSHNITANGLVLNNNPQKPQYIRSQDYDIGPAIVVNRIVGQPGKGKIRAALIPRDMRFLAENHVNVIFPDKRQKLMNGSISKKKLVEILKQLNLPEKAYSLQSITGNTQISKTELEKLFPISI